MNKRNILPSSLSTLSVFHHHKCCCCGHRCSCCCLCVVVLYLIHVSASLSHSQSFTVLRLSNDSRAVHRGAASILYDNRCPKGTYDDDNPSLDCMGSRVTQGEPKGRCQDTFCQRGSFEVVTNARQRAVERRMTNRRRACYNNRRTNEKR